MDPRIAALRKRVNTRISLAQEEDSGIHSDLLSNTELPLGGKEDSN